MKFTRDISSVTTIRRVADDAIVIGDNRYTQAIALTPDGLVEGFVPPSLAELCVSDFDILLEHEPELVIVGAGARTVFPPRELTFAFARRRIGLEVMDTAAAARTFNVLAGEGRRLAAVLYI